MRTVSVVTPSYNQAEFIGDTLQSVKRQSYDAVDHIVIDGGSTDGTVSMLEQYDVEWVSEPDDGQADAINKGFDRASGDIVGWLNSDDVYFDVDVISRVVEYFECFDADIIYGDIAWLNARSEVLKLWVVPDFDYEMLRRYCFIEQPAVFFDMGVVKEHKLDTSMETANDYEYWLRLGRKYTFRHVRDVLAGDRNHPARKSLAMREQLEADSERIRSMYDADRTTPRLTRMMDYAFSGIPRGVETLLRTIKLHRDQVGLAFDGRLRPLPEMCVNVYHQNHLLV